MEAEMFAVVLFLQRKNKEIYPLVQKFKGRGHSSEFLKGGDTHELSNLYLTHYKIKTRYVFTYMAFQMLMEFNKF